MILHLIPSPDLLKGLSQVSVKLCLFKELYWPVSSRLTNCDDRPRMGFPDTFCQVRLPQFSAGRDMMADVLLPYLV